jgi:hypothetical protein
MRGLFVRSFALLFWIGSFFATLSVNANLESISCRMAQRARESHSDSVLIMHCNRPIFEYHSGESWKPLETMSITQSIATLAIGLMIEERKLASVDVPVYHFYPEWDQGNKKLITIRHLLNHTSGLQAETSPDEIYRTEDIIQLALCAELSTQPGTHYFYNNKAINLIAGIVKKATGYHLSEYLTFRLFTPLGIENISLLSDKAGNNYVMAHMIMTAPDLAKIGQMIGSQGMWCGKRILSQEWINFMSQPGQCFDPFCGLSWWMDYYNYQCYWDDSILQEYQNAGVSPEFIKRLDSLQGRIIDINGFTKCSKNSNIFSEELIGILGGQESADCFYNQVRRLQLPFARWKIGCLKFLSARSCSGQQLIIMPSKHLVAVRQSRVGGKLEIEADPFHDFGALVEELAYRVEP